ncbi:dephospho-CoA kinase [Paraglaciecola Antarctic GD virus 1]|nr:dephospho-CoA kinase [Paraglaciecola Antarctic GD virus 1]
MKYIVFGHKRHGKDAVCELLAEWSGMTHMSSSWYCCKKFIFEDMRLDHNYESPEECFNDRNNHRQYWYESIRNYNKDDRARLGKEIFAEHDIYCGIRDQEEFDAIKAAGLFDAAVWIDASRRLPPEEGNSMNLGPESADVILNNNEEEPLLLAEVIKVFFKGK